ncbi:MAG: hypothetical protein Q9P44_02710 [Anaerolineae bacterium]|nr:hypothetical protein [Anaerolineae bacterium]
MDESTIWVWCGENVNSHDLNNWHMVKRLLEVSKNNGDYIIEFQTRSEVLEFEVNLRNKGWHIDAEASQNTPHVTCWRRAFASPE